MTASERCIAAVIDQACRGWHFFEGSYTNAASSREYKLYVPSCYESKRLPLIVMLHGCKQNPDDFAAGTQMNTFAERFGFIVVYPRQTSRANGANCWRWYDPREQTRDGEEPSILAGIVSDVCERYAVARKNVFVAGLSAGASMAVILGQIFPEVFAGVAAHSGLPWGAAHSVVSAFTAMRGTTLNTPLGFTLNPVRTSVIHGYEDDTVQLANGKAITQQAIAAFEKEANFFSPSQPGLKVFKGVVKTDNTKTTWFYGLDGADILRVTV